MERNADDMFGATGDRSSTPSSASPLGSGSTGMSGRTGSTEGADYSTSTTASSGTSAQTSKADQAKAKLGQVRDKARELQSTLADRLDAGAEKLRQRRENATLAAASQAGSVGVGVTSDDRMMNVQDSVARGMSKSADWLRNGDLKADLEKQVRENPGRTLLIALGVGYLLGKAFRSSSNR